MKRILIGAALVTLPLSLAAQVDADLSPLPDGTTEIRITNQTTVELTAFAVRVNETNGVIEGGQLLVYSDSVVDAKVMPVLPHEQRLLESGRRFVKPLNGKGRYAAFEQPVVIGGIFADGRTTGNSTLVNLLLLRRRNLLLAVEMSLDVLTDAGGRNVPRDQLIGQFRKMEESVNRWYLSAEQRVGRSLYQAIIAELIALPEAQTGSPFPPSIFVKQETADLSRQRLTLVESEPSLAYTDVH